MRGNRFVSSVYIAAGYEFLVSLDDGVCDECGFLMNVVSGGMIA